MTIYRSQKRVGGQRFKTRPGLPCLCYFESASTSCIKLRSAPALPREAFFRDRLRDHQFRRFGFWSIMWPTIVYVKHMYERLCYRINSGYV